MRFASDACYSSSPVRSTAMTALWHVIAIFGLRKTSAQFRRKHTDRSILRALYAQKQEFGFLPHVVLDCYYACVWLEVASRFASFQGKLPRQSPRPTSPAPLHLVASRQVGSSVVKGRGGAGVCGLQRHRNLICRVCFVR